MRGWAFHPESDHAALKRLTNPMRGFRSLRSAKATLKGIETIRTIKRGQFHNLEPGVAGEVKFIAHLFPTAA